MHGSFFAKSKNELTATASEFALEFIDATSGIDEAFFARVSRVGIRRHIARNHAVFNAINHFFFFGRKRRCREKFAPRRNVAEAHQIDGRMNFFFHDSKTFFLP